MFLPNRPIQAARPYKKGGMVSAGKLLQNPTDMHLSQTIDGSPVVHIPKSNQKPSVIRGGNLATGKLVQTAKPKPKKAKSKVRKAKK